MQETPESTIPQPLAYSPGEAARVSGLGRTTIYKLMKEGQLRSRKIGARTIIRADDLLGLITGKQAA